VDRENSESLYPRPDPVFKEAGSCRDVPGVSPHLELPKHDLRCLIITPRVRLSVAAFNIFGVVSKPGITVVWLPTYSNAWQPLPDTTRNLSASRPEWPRDRYLAPSLGYSSGITS
jgi:hypothetical protein